MHKPLHFAIIGCGVISDWHAQSIKELPGLELVGASDVYAPSLQKFADKYGIKAYPDVQALLADPLIDAVCICTPSGLHAPLAVAAADAGKHIVIEKPMALTHEQSASVLEAVKRNGVKLECISQNRCTAPIQYVHRAIAEGRLGKIINGDVYMKFYRSPEYYASGVWRGTWEMDGGGALMNQGIHGVDIAQFLCGPVRSVFAHTRTFRHSIEVEDTVSAVLTYESGALGVLQATTSVTPGYPRIMEINGTHGSVRLKDTEIVEWAIDGEEKPDDLPTSVIKGDTSSDPKAFTIDGHKKQIEDLANAIWNDNATMVDQFDGKSAVDIILAVYESGRTGKEVFLK